MTILNHDDVRVRDYGKGYVSYSIVFEDVVPTGNKLQIQFDETRSLFVSGDTVSLSESDIKRLRIFLDSYTTLPDQRK